MENTFCTFYIVRHGETEWNVKGLIQGQKDLPLNPEGIKQAHILAKELESIHFDNAFSSDLERAKKTAEIVVLEKKLAVETSKLLRERSFGKFEGQPLESLKLIDDLVGKLKEQKDMQNEHLLEADDAVIGRLITFLREVAVANPQKTMLVVTHGGMMRVFLQHLGLLQHTKTHNFIKNTAYIKLRTDGIEFFVDETKGIDLAEEI